MNICLYFKYVSTQKIHDDFGENLKSFLEITGWKFELYVRKYTRTKSCIHQSTTEGLPIVVELIDKAMSPTLICT